MPSLGFSVGSTLGGLLFPTKQPNTFGPQMGDLSVTSSAYGADIPFGFGTMRIGGNIIWASPIQEVVNKSKGGKGKGKGGGGKGGGGGGETTTYTYYGNWAVGFAHGPATSVSRIWFDGVLVYNSIGTSGIDGSGTVQLTGLNFRFYKGDETQVADPLIESWIAIGDVSPASTHGTFKSGTTPSTPAGEPAEVSPGSQAVPGHRGLCYIVIENWCLTNSGNRIPMVTAEISFGVTPNYPFQLLVPNTDPVGSLGLPTAGDVFAGVAVDLLRQTSYRVSNVDGVGYIRRFDPVSMTEDFIKPIDTDDPEGDGIATTPITGSKEISFITMALDGFLYIQGPSMDHGPGVHSSLLMKVDPNSLSEVGRVDTAFYAGLVIDGGHPGGMCLGYEEDGKLHHWIIQKIFDGSIGLIETDELFFGLFVERNADGSAVQYRSPYSSIFGSSCYGVLPDSTREPKLQAWGVALFGPSHPFGVANPVEFYGLDAMNGIFELDGEFFADDINAVADVPAPGTDMQMAHGMWADPSTASILFIVSIGQDNVYQNMLVSYNIAVKELNWATNISAQGIGVPNDTAGSSIQSTILNHQLAWVTGQPNVVTIIDTLDGSVSVTQWPENGSGGADGGIFGQQVYDGYIGAIIGAVGDIKIFVDRHNPTSTTVGTIVRAMSQRVGLQSTDLDTTEIDDIIIKGYFIGQPTSTRDAILPLAQAYLFDAVESDGVIKFPLRGKSVVRSLVQAHDLAPVDQKSNLVVLETRAQEVDLPVYLAVSYYDGNNNYQQGTRIRRRSAVPIQNDPSGAQNVPTVHTQNVAMLQWPIVLDAQTAIVAADKYLYTTWLERTTFKQKLHWGHMDLDPSDVVTVELTDGTTYTQRLTKLVLGGDLSIECDAASESSAVYDSTAVGGEDFQIVVTGGGPSFTKLLLLPTPLLSDQASAGQEHSVLFYGASNYSPASYPGCAVNMSNDLENWTVKDQDPYKVAWGSTSTVLPDRLDPFSWDDDSELTVFLKNGATLENATDAELLDGQNGMAVFNLDGNPEVIQFGNAVLNDDGSYTISHLLRGRRGTDTWTTNHGFGQRVVVLDEPFIRTIALDLSDLQQLRYFKGVGIGLTIDFADLEAMTSPGNDLKPYAPVHVAAAHASCAWDTAFDSANYTVSSVNRANDRAANNGVGAGTVRSATAIPPGKWYVEFPYAFGINSSCWGFCDADHPATGTNLGGSAHSVQLVDALHTPGSFSRFCVAINATADRAWYRFDAGAWKGAGGSAGDPVVGTNGVVLSGMAGDYFLAAFTSSGAESVTIEGPSTQQQLPPLGYIAGVPGADLVLSWARRTRIGGGLHDLTGVVPLNEGSEVYDVEVIGTNSAESAVVAVSGDTGSFAPGDVLTLIGGTLPVAPSFTVTSTKAREAAVASGGSGGSPGTATLTGTTGTGVPFQAIGTISGGGVLTGTLTISVPGEYTANPTDVANEPVTGNGLVGATVALGMDVLEVELADGGTVEAAPANPADTTSSGTGTGCQLTVTYGEGAVKRTYSGVTEPTKTYPAADVAADWGTTPTALTLRVYQVSAVPVVGRGFTQQVTVEVD